MIYRIIQQLLTLIRLTILARILSPNDFGMMGIALLTIAALETFSQTGFQAALVQTKKNIASYLDTAWTILVLRGIILFSLLFFLAPYVAIFFEMPQAKLLLQLIGLSIIFQAATNIGVIYFIKDLEFSKQVLYKFSGVLAEFTVAISTAFIFENVWSLVFGFLSGKIALFLASYIIHPYRPRFKLDITKAKELFEFGKWVLISSILVFLITQGDDIFVGKLIGVAAFGLYQMAYRISNIPTTEITHVISQVTFPAYSKIQNDIQKLREAYLRVLKVTAFLSFPITGLILVLSPDFTKLFLGEKWMPMVPAMQILVLAGLLRSIAATSGYLFYAVGKPKIDMKWQVIRLIVMIILIYPLGTKYGIFGVSFVVLLSILFSNIGFSFNTIKIIKCTSKDYVLPLLIPLISGLFAMLTIGFLKVIIGHGILQFIALTCAGSLLYLFWISVFDRKFNYGMKQLIIEYLGRFRGAKV